MVDYELKKGQKWDKLDGLKYLVKRLTRSAEKLDSYLINDLYIIS